VSYPASWVVVFAGWLPAALAGAALWGLGGALGYPIGMSTAGDDAELAAARVGVVTSIGWLAFLLGPPLIGLLGSQIGTLHSLLAVLAFSLLGVVLSGVVRHQDVELDPLPLTP
jgi:MFS family permease